MANIRDTRDHMQIVTYVVDLEPGWQDYVASGILPQMTPAQYAPVRPIYPEAKRFKIVVHLPHFGGLDETEELHSHVYAAADDGPPGSVK